MRQLITIMAVAVLLAGLAHAQIVHLPKVQADDLGGESLTMGTRKESGYEYDHQTEQSRSWVEYGTNTVAIGEDVVSRGRGTIAFGYGTFADGRGTVVGGRYARARDTDDFAVVWSGNLNRYDGNPYEAKGPGTFCVDPTGGADGFYVGDTPLSSLVGGGGGGGVQTVPTFDDHYDEYNTNRTVVTFPYTVDLSNGCAQYFMSSGPGNTNMVISLPQVDYSVAGHLTLYIRQSPYSSSYFDFEDSYDLRGLPASHPWMTDTNGGIWKVEFDTVPDMPGWWYVGSTHYN